MAESTVKYSMFDLREHLEKEIEDLNQGLYENSNIDKAAFRRSIENEIAKIDFKVQANIRSIIPKILGQSSYALGMHEHDLVKRIKDYCEKFTDKDIEKTIYNMQLAKQLRKKLLVNDWGELNKGFYYSLE